MRVTVGSFPATRSGASPRNNSVSRRRAHCGIGHGTQRGRSRTTVSCAVAVGEIPRKRGESPRNPRLRLRPEVNCSARVLCASCRRANESDARTAVANRSRDSLVRADSLRLALNHDVDFGVWISSCPHLTLLMRHNAARFSRTRCASSTTSRAQFRNRIEARFTCAATMRVHST